ncbi:hypothetical protein DFP73DRAFT_355116 [Morchella snyderi]|nr:hypothetical protein DFP73DRAFT_355116 [Morchella snyderi]
MNTLNTNIPHYHMPPRAPMPAPFPTYPITHMPRRMLPTGDCGFVVYCADPLPPFVFNAAQSVRCQCRSYWPNPHTPDLCACGHHACYHSNMPQQSTTSTPPAPTPAPPAPSSPSSVLTMGAVANLMKRVSRLEQELEVQRELEMKRGSRSRPQSELEMKEVVCGLRGIDEKVDELLERVDEAEERLSGAERIGVEFEGRLNELEVRADEIEDDFTGLVRQDEEDEEEEERERLKKETMKNMEIEAELESESGSESESETGRNAAVKVEPVTATATGEIMAGGVVDTKAAAAATAAKGAAITSACIILAQPPFNKTFSLKRRSSDSNLLLVEHSSQPAAKRIRCQSSGGSISV